MKILLPAMMLLASACSAATASGGNRYDRAIECELLTGTMAAFHPSLSHKDRIALQQGNAHYNRESERLGSEIKKSAFEIDLDRRKFLLALQKELTDSDANTVANAKFKIAQTCAGEV